MKLRLAVILLFVLAATQVFGAVTCNTIQSGLIHYGSGPVETVTTGFDPWGYNYQAHMFLGSYFNAYARSAGYQPYVSGDDASDAAYLSANQGADGHWAWPYRTITVEMKWNDAWLSNKDCDGDGVLDRHYGFPGYIGSGAWLTNHMSDSYDGIHWTDFVKMVAVPASATKTSGTWFSSDDVEIGPDIWGEFAVIQEVYNDPGVAAHGVLSKSALNPGFGYYKP